MSPASPNGGGSSLVTFTVQVNGAKIPTPTQVESIETWSSLGKVPRSRVVIFDGNAAGEGFPLSSSSLFVPGNELKISAGYDNRGESEIFRGVIVKQGLEIQRDQPSRLVVEAADEALRMTLERKNGIFENLRDSELIEALAKRNGVRARVARTQTRHEEIVQYYATDWDLMMIRAEMNGYVVRVAGGELEVAAPDTSQTPALAVEYGATILDLATEMDATTQVAASAIRSTAWDPSSQKVVEAGPGRVSVTEPGAISSEELAEVFRLESFVQQTGGTVEPATLEAWSSAELLRSKLAKIRGTVTFRGSSAAEAGGTLELQGLGTSFDGKAYMSGVFHRIRGGSWVTTAELGLSARWFAAEAPHVAAPEASGQLPPISGLQTGLVKKVAKDPGGELRVFVDLPLLRQGGDGVWARLATFYASANVGAFFYPETGDEVVVGFMNEDPRYPVILGSVYSQKNAPPLVPEEKNEQKMLKTRGELEISFDDKDKILRLLTPGGHSVTLDDKAKSLVIEDSNGNRARFEKRGITLDSPKDLELRAGGDVKVSAGGSLALSAKTSATLDAAQVTARAKGKLSAQGSGSAELKSTGILTVRGSLVKIN